MDEKIKVMPCACFSHDDQGGRLRIDMEMPGVEKKDIALEMRKDIFAFQPPKDRIPSMLAVLGWPMRSSLKKQKLSTKVDFSRSSPRSRTGITG